VDRISLCLIAKNEEQLLPGCLASVKGAVDEIVIADTGSSDRTREIARAAGAVVVESPWLGDFAAARNASLAAAHGDWILILDADERLAPGAGRALRRAVRDARFDVGMIPLHNASRLDATAADVLAGRARDGTPTLLPRLLRNAGGLRYEGIVHESVEGWLVGRGRKAGVIETAIIHLGHVAELRAARGKRERNLELLRRRCQEDPDDVIAWGYLAGEHLHAGHEVEARAAVEAGWALVDHQPNERSIHRVAALRGILALRRGDAAAALESADRAEARQGPHVDWHYLRGCALELLALAEPDEAARRERARAAAAAYQAAYDGRHEPVAERIVEGSDQLASLVSAGHVLLLAGRPVDALAAFEAALRELPADPAALLGRAEAVLDGGDPARALSLLEPLLGDRPDGWLLAAAAAAALGSAADASVLLTRALDRTGSGLLGRHRKLRLRAMTAGGPRAATAGASPVATAGPRFAVTVISPPGYPHSAAFAEVAETLVHGLGAAGCDAVLTTDPSLPGRRHIVLGANLVPGTSVRLLPGSIIYNLEQVEEGSSWLTPELLALFRAFQVWDYSRANADALEQMGVPRPAVVPVGYVPQLTRIAPAAEDLDVLFYGSMNPRRRMVLDELTRRGARVHAAFGLYGAARDALVARSRIVVNVHYYQAKVFEVVRVSYLLANRRCVVSERGCDAAEEAAFEEGVAFAAHEALADRCLHLLAHPDERHRIAEAGFRIMSSRDEAGYLRDVVAGLASG